MADAALDIPSNSAQGFVSPHPLENSLLSGCVGLLFHLIFVTAGVTRYGPGGSDLRFRKRHGARFHGLPTHLYIFCT